MPKKPSHATALEILKLRNGEPSDVLLSSGQAIRVYNIAWVYDLGNPVAYVTTNISPRPEVEHTSESFIADEVCRILDPENNAIWFDITGQG